MLEPSPPYSELAVLHENLDYLKRSLGVADIRIAAAPCIEADGPYPAEPRIELFMEADA